jgi:hypothetical protein
MTDDRFEQFETFTATLTPQRTDDLKPGVADWIGWRGTWQTCWIIDESDYEGDWACAPLPDQDPLPPASAFAWAPSRDLSDIERVDRPGRWVGAI